MSDRPRIKPLREWNVNWPGALVGLSLLASPIAIRYLESSPAATPPESRVEQYVPLASNDFHEETIELFLPADLGCDEALTAYATDARIELEEIRAVQALRPSSCDDAISLLRAADATDTSLEQLTTLLSSRSGARQVFPTSTSLRDYILAGGTQEFIQESVSDVRLSRASFTLTGHRLTRLLASHNTVEDVAEMSYLRAGHGQQGRFLFDDVDDILDVLQSGMSPSVAQYLTFHLDTPSPQDLIRFAEEQGTPAIAEAYRDAARQGNRPLTSLNALSRLMRLQVTPEQYAAPRQTERPDAHVIFALYDYNQAFESERFLGQLQGIRDNYDTLISFVSNEQELYAALDAVTGTDLLKIVAHGLPTAMMLSTPKYAEQNLLDVDDAELQEHLGGLADDATIWLRSCLTGRESMVVEPLARRVQEMAGPTRSVIASAASYNADAVSIESYVPLQLRIIRNEADVTYRSGPRFETSR